MNAEVVQMEDISQRFGLCRDSPNRSQSTSESHNTSSNSPRLVVPASRARHVSARKCNDGRRGVTLYKHKAARLTNRATAVKAGLLGITQADWPQFF
jgi:hypothetical protein